MTLHADGPTGKPPVTLWFGEHKGKPLPEVPTSYLRWAIKTVRLSSGIRQAVSDELRRRGVHVPPPPPPRPQRCQRCGRVDAISYTWMEDRRGQRRIQRLCSCGGAAGFAPQVEPYVSLANASASDTPILDVLTQCEDLGVELVSDGDAIHVARGWERVSPELRARIAQVRHALAQRLGRGGSTGEGEQ